MAEEIERKYLVKNKSYQALAEGEIYRQGYISRTHGKVVRIRTAGSLAYLTVKAATESAVTRLEYEYLIPITDAQEMLANLCEKPIIEKTRYKIPIGCDIWEVDEFHGENEGLTIAEIEIPSEDYAINLPTWIGEEVTNDPRYINANLIDHPFCKW